MVFHVTEISHFRNEKGTGAEMGAAIVSRIVYWERAGQLLANFFPVLSNNPRSLCEVNSTQFPRF